MRCARSAWSRTGEHGFALVREAVRIRPPTACPGNSQAPPCGRDDSNRLPWRNPARGETAGAGDRPGGAPCRQIDRCGICPSRRARMLLGRGFQGSAGDHPAPPLQVENPGTRRGGACLAPCPTSTPAASAVVPGAGRWHPTVCGLRPVDDRLRSTRTAVAATTALCNDRLRLPAALPSTAGSRQSLACRAWGGTGVVHH